MSSIMVHFRSDPALFELAKCAASDAGITLSAYIRAAIFRDHAAALREREVERLRAEVERLRSVLADSAGLVEALLVERAALHSVLAEPSEEEVWRLACLVGAPDTAVDARLRVEHVRRLLADLRKRAGVGDE